MPTDSLKRSKTVSVSEFKARALEFFEQAATRSQEIVVTKRGVPIARVVPIGPRKSESRRGSLKGKIEINGDIVSTSLTNEWEALREVPARQVKK